MSYSTFPTDLAPDFVFPELGDHHVIKTEFESGDVQLRPRFEKAVRVWRLQWNHATKEMFEKIVSFIQAHTGPLEPFYFTLPDKLSPPFLPPELSYQPGGSFSSRTLIAGYTWGSATAETTISTQTETINVPAGNLLTVSVPAFPNNVDRVWVYVGTSSVDLKKQPTAITESGGSWQEPESGYDQTGTNPPSSNNFEETVLVNIRTQSFEAQRNFLNDFTVAFEIIENF